MCAYIGIEDLAANALIEILSNEKTKDNKFVSYKTLEEYGMEVIGLLTEQGENAILILSREETRKMFRDYSDIFEEKCQNGETGVVLKEGITIKELIFKFRCYLSLEVLLAFMNEKSKRILWK